MLTSFWNFLYAIFGDVCNLWIVFFVNFKIIKFSWKAWILRQAFLNGLADIWMRLKKLCLQTFGPQWRCFFCIFVQIELIFFNMFSDVFSCWTPNRFWFCLHVIRVVRHVRVFWHHKYYNLWNCTGPLHVP
jgi:hypothetical protein